MAIIRVALLLICGLYSPAHAFSAYSNSELDELEKEFVQHINQSNAVIRDPLANQYIKHLSTTLAQHGDMPAPSFFIVRSGEINAFAGPGGYIGINSQLILVSGDESELAAVMAHEMAHVRQHHLYDMIEHQKQMRIPMLASTLASLALGVINPTLASGALMGSMSGFAQNNINYIRAHEKEADRIGINMLIKSDIDPHGMIQFFKKMQQQMRYYYTNNIPAILRTHPLDEDRIAEAENRCLNIDKTSKVSHYDYAFVKERIRTLVARDKHALQAYYQGQCLKETTHAACEYGAALTQLDMQQYQAAVKQLSSLLIQDPNNLNVLIALANAETAAKQYDQAIKRLRTAYTNYPDNYAILIEYANTLTAANQPTEATHVLRDGRRVFKQDLSLCQAMARAESESQRKGYAYFTWSECHLLQGETREAVRNLKMAKTLSGQDHVLQAKIQARLDELKAIAKAEPAELH